MGSPTIWDSMQQISLDILNSHQDSEGLTDWPQSQRLGFLEKLGLLMGWAGYSFANQLELFWVNSQFLQLSPQFDIDLMLTLRPQTLTFRRLFRRGNQSSLGSKKAQTLLMHP